MYLSVKPMGIETAGSLNILLSQIRQERLLKDELEVVDFFFGDGKSVDLRMSYKVMDQRLKGLMALCNWKEYAGSMFDASG